MGSSLFIVSRVGELRCFLAGQSQTSSSMRALDAADGDRYEVTLEECRLARKQAEEAVKQAKANLVAAHAALARANEAHAKAIGGMKDVFCTSQSPP